MSAEPKIVACTISPRPKGFCDPLPTVTVTYDNGETEELFFYYPDEISFRDSEFIGRTRKEAFELKFKKDLAYLQS